MCINVFGYLQNCKSHITKTNEISVFDMYLNNKFILMHDCNCPSFGKNVKLELLCNVYL